MFFQILKRQIGASHAKILSISFANILKKQLKILEILKFLKILIRNPKILKLNGTKICKIISKKHKYFNALIFRTHLNPICVRFYNSEPFSWTRRQRMRPPRMRTRIGTRLGKIFKRRRARLEGRGRVVGVWAKALGGARAVWRGFERSPSREPVQIRRQQLYVVRILILWATP